MVDMKEFIFHCNHGVNLVEDGEPVAQNTGGTKVDKSVERRSPDKTMDYFFMSSKDEEAKSNLVVGVINGKVCEKYTRAAEKNGVGQSGEADCLPQDMVEELNTWGHTGGAKMDM